MQHMLMYTVRHSAVHGKVMKSNTIGFHIVITLYDVVNIM